MTDSVAQAFASELQDIRFDAPPVIDLLRRYHVTRLRVYGSILREDFDAEMTSTCLSSSILTISQDGQCSSLRRNCPLCWGSRWI